MNELNLSSVAMSTSFHW